MYKYLGDTGIKMYNLLGLLSFCLALFYNLFIIMHDNYKIGQLSALIKTKLKKMFAISINRKFFLIVEFFLVSSLQIGLNPILTSFMQDLAGTDTSNYFGVAFFNPIFIIAICVILGLDIFKCFQAITPAYALALFINKLGCFCAGCCEGIECSFGLYNHSTDLIEFPVQLVESGAALLIFILLVIIRKKVKEGTLYPIFLILYSATRFFSEFLRHEENVFWIFKRYHLLCIAGVIIGILQLFLISKYKEKIDKFSGKSCYIIIDFINAVLFSLKIRKVKKDLHQNKDPRKRYKYEPLQSEIKFDFQQIRMWVLIWSLGLIGQIGWNIETTWFNTFIYDKIDKNPSIITPMLILSALATTVSIWLLGTKTDRTGNRRSLISTGYIVWGVLLMGFGLTQFLAKDFFSFAIFAIIIGDMLISFFASMSTDVGYSTWLTDIMNDKNRGQIGGAIAVQCLLGSLIGTVIGGKLVGSNNNYLKMFFVIGSFLLVFGIIARVLFTKKDDIKVIPRGTFKKQLFEVVDKNVFKHKELLWVNISVAIFFIGFNIYFPHLGNYLIDYLGYSAYQMGLIEAIPLIMAMVITIPASKYINNDKFLEISGTSIISGLLGAFIIHQISPESIDINMAFDIRLFLGVFLIGSSYIVMLQATKVWTKKLLPANNKGQYEVLYAIAYALIPMLFASNIGEAIIKQTGLAMLNEITQRYEYIPNGNLFLIGTIISAVSIIPIIITKKYSKKRLAETVNK